MRRQSVTGSSEKEPGNEATCVVCWSSIHVAAYIVKLSLILYFPQCIRSGLLEVLLSTSFAGSMASTTVEPLWHTLNLANAVHGSNGHISLTECRMFYLLKYRQTISNFSIPCRFVRYHLQNTVHVVIL